MKPIEDLGLSPGEFGRLRNAVPALHRWYRANARSLPWRRTRDPYAIWVSEVMLQQTRVAAVIPYFETWITRFPTVGALARADEQSVLKTWEGLGYYSRARNLHRAAGIVEKRFAGRVPSDPVTFRSLPGVGAYTTAAVLSIAFGLDLAAVDGNVRRVLARLVALGSDPRSAPHTSALAKLAHGLLPPGTAATHNQAMMELGASLCTPRSPDCPDCPFGDTCAALASGNPESFPARRKTKPIPHHDVALGIIFHEDRIFIDKRPYGGLLGGLWEFPGGKVEAGETVERALHRELHEEFGMTVEVLESLSPVPHAYSHFQVTLHPSVCRFVEMAPGARERQPWRWVDPQDLARYPMPKANRKVLQQLEDWERD